MVTMFDRRRRGSASSILFTAAGMGDMPESFKSIDAVVIRHLSLLPILDRSRSMTPSQVDRELGFVSMLPG